MFGALSVDRRKLFELDNRKSPFALSVTYALFHLLFNVPLLLVLWWFARKRMTGTHWKWIGVVCLIVLAFTFPWDNYAVGKGIWNFPEERVLLRIDNLPIEEIGFFLFETLAVCLLVVLFLPRRGER